MYNFGKSFGENAGRLYKTLTIHGPLPQTRLKETTMIKDEEFFMAIGWLARENKICKDGNNYKLGETNLTRKIGGDAGKVWQVLNAWGEVDNLSIGRLGQLDEKDVFSAVGWLAREGKIRGKKIKTKEKKMKFWLK